MKWALLISVFLTMGCSIIPKCEKYEQMVWYDYNAKTQTSYYGCVRYAKDVK